MLPRNIESTDDEGNCNPLLSLMMQERWAELRYKVVHPTDNSGNKYFWKSAQEVLEHEKK